MKDLNKIFPTTQLPVPQVPSPPTLFVRKLSLKGFITGGDETLSTAEHLVVSLCLSLHVSRSEPIHGFDYWALESFIKLDRLRRNRAPIVQLYRMLTCLTVANVFIGRSRSPRAMLLARPIVSFTQHNKVYEGHLSILFPRFCSNSAANELAK